MQVLLEKPRLEEKAVQAETGIGTTKTGSHDCGLYSRFFELPVPVVLVTLWVAGAALIGGCALSLYHLLWL